MLYTCFAGSSERNGVVVWTRVFLLVLLVPLALLLGVYLGMLLVEQVILP
jgi:hypothetical protein